jgi:hypothetical protein
MLTRILLTLTLLLLSTVAFAAAPPVPFEDVNCNGVLDVGDVPLDFGAPGNPPRSLWIVTNECLVVPRGSISAKPWAHIFVLSSQRVTWGANTTTAMTDPEAYSWIKGAPLIVLPNTYTSAGGEMYIGSECCGGAMVVGDGTRWTSAKSYVDLISTDPAGLTVGRNVVMRALDRAGIIAEAGPLTVAPGLNALVTGEFGQVLINSTGPLDVSGAVQIKANGLDVVTPAQPISFRENYVRTLFPEWGYVAIWSQAFTPSGRVLGPVDVTGSRFVDLDPQIIGAPVVR